MTFAPGDIVIADLGAIPSGYEQAGVRPAAFVSAEGGVSLLIPLSANAARAQFKGTAHIKPSAKNRLWRLCSSCALLTLAVFFPASELFQQKRSTQSTKFCAP